MDKFIVSARKYRPQLFDTVVGQNHITTTLKNAIKNEQLAHAFLFCGPRGVGKTTCARILAKTINCETRTAEGEACNVCNSCISFNDGASFNVHELDAASNNSVDDIRSLVDQVRFAPQAGKYKVYIIDEVHMLSPSAFNAFLKTLEEPPSYAIFILATTEKHKIIPTILSRCQIFDFKRITIMDTVKHLEKIVAEEHIEAEKAALQLIAQKSEGCLRDALSIMDKIVSFTSGHLTYTETLEHLNILDADYYFQFLENMQSQKVGDSLLLFDEINSKGFEGDTVLNGLAEFFRNLLVCKDAKASVLLDSVEAFKKKYEAAAKTTDAALILSALHLLNEAEISYRSAKNKKLHTELSLIKLTYLSQAVQLYSGENGVSKKKITDNNAALPFKNIVAFTPLIEKKQESKKQEPEAVPAVLEPASIYQPMLEVQTAHTPINTKENNEKPAKSDKLAALQSLRKQIKADLPVDNNSKVEALALNNLQTHWQNFIKNNYKETSPAVTSFQQAKLNIVDDNCFEIICTNNVAKTFIDQEKEKILNYLSTHLNNTLLRFTTRYDESEEQPLPENTTLNAAEQLQLLESAYPAITELRKKLFLYLNR